jgi:hypothetical protein
MNPDLDFVATFLLEHLERIAAQLEIEVRYESLDDEELTIRSGGCRLLGQHLIIMDLSASTRERARILARELSGYDLEGIYLPPRIREFIVLHSGPREKNLPQT